MDGEVLAARPRVLHEDVGCDVPHLPDDVELAHPVEAGAPVGDRFELLPVRLVDLADRMQPVVHQAAPFPVDCGADAAAAVMSHHDDVLYFQHVDRELQHREIVGVLRGSEVGDVAVHEQLAGIEVDDLVGRHPAVGAADPQIFRRLLAFEPPKEAGVVGDHSLRPSAIVGLEVLQHPARIAPALASHKPTRVAVVIVF